jgi:hypothetical protein
MKYLAFSSISKQNLLLGLEALVKFAEGKSAANFDFYDMASALDQFFLEKKMPFKSHTFLSVLFDDMERSDSVAKKVKPEALIEVLSLLPDRLKQNIPDSFIEKSIPKKFWTDIRNNQWISLHS